MSDKQSLFEKESVLRAVLNLALPSILGQIILVIYNMADTLFVGLTESDAMITAVTVCMPAFLFLSAISNLFGIGGASVIARSLGKGDTERARRTSAFAIYGTVFVTVLYCLFAWLFKDWFVNLLGGGNPAVHQNAVSYLIIVVAIGGLSASLSGTLSHLIRAYGYSVQASAGVAIGGVLNIVLDPLFMFVILPKGQEALGAALATALSNFVSLVYYAAVIVVKRKKLNISVRPSGKMFRNRIPFDVIRVGIAACLMTLCENISYAVLDKLMAAVGTSAQAGIGVAKKVNMLAHSFVRGMSQGVLPLIAYNYGAGNRERMRKVVWVSGTISALIALSCTAVCLLFSPSLIGIFIRTKGQSLSFGSVFLRILCTGAPFSSLAYTVISFFQATGHGETSLLLALLRKGLVDIPLMFILNATWPVYGIVFATPITDFLCSIVAAVLFFIFLRKKGNNPVKPAAD